jgi:hypothetical protein
MWDAWYFGRVEKFRAVAAAVVTGLCGATERFIFASAAKKRLTASSQNG